MSGSSFSMQRVSGLSYGSFETVLTIGRWGTFELENDREGRKAFTEVARWVHTASQKQTRTLLELCMHCYPEASAERGGPPSRSVDVAIGLVVGRSGYRRGLQPIKGYLAELVERAEAVDDAFWDEAEQKLGLIMEFAREVYESGADAYGAAERFLAENPELVGVIIALGVVAIIALVADDLTIAGVADDWMVPIVAALEWVAIRIALFGSSAGAMAHAVGALRVGALQ